MKTVKIGLMALAFVVGIGGAFAARLDAQAWFYLDTNGQPTGNALPGNPSCPTGNRDCAQIYTIDGSGNPVTPVGNPTKGMLHQ